MFWAPRIFGFYLVNIILFSRMAEQLGLGCLMAIGKSQPKVYIETDTKVTLKDVVGVDEAKFELQRVVAFSRIGEPTSGQARVPRGILLTGPLGAGKARLMRNAVQILLGR
ncbi:hypothetical protein [Microvirga vignae]|uniref:hypothetical protein n=1 Tax=Microvirga vignae TaxID=1225564 RepID=UPI0006400601|nr:hypothetical protein [Microvirga vignae]